jgi:hypothetical protein
MIAAHRKSIFALARPSRSHLRMALCNHRTRPRPSNQIFDVPVENSHASNAIAAPLTQIPLALVKITSNRCIPEDDLICKK